MAKYAPMACGAMTMATRTSTVARSETALMISIYYLKLTFSLTVRVKDSLSGSLISSQHSGPAALAGRFPKCPENFSSGNLDGRLHSFLNDASEKFSRSFRYDLSPASPKYDYSSDLYVVNR